MNHTKQGTTASRITNPIGSELDKTPNVEFKKKYYKYIQRYRRENKIPIKNTKRRMK